MLVTSDATRERQPASWKIPDHLASADSALYSYSKGLPAFDKAIKSKYVQKIASDGYIVRSCASGIDRELQLGR
jgi:hypothetical protein